MANINKLQMGKTVCADERIAVSKALLGLRTRVTYLPTNSNVDVKTLEYSAADGDKLKAVLTGNRGELGKAVAGFRPQPTVNGNYLVELCLSADRAFVAVQLLRIAQMSYEPVSDVLMFEGDEARTVSQLF